MFSDGDSVSIVPFPGRPGRRHTRERMLEAILVVSGERGYRNVAVRHVIEAAGTSRATFYKYFDDREDCFALAYGDASEWLYRRLAGAARRQPSWRAGLRAALAELLEFCANQPAIAKALLVEAHVAGPRATVQRRELMQRLAKLLDSGHKEESPGRPAIAPDFFVGAIDTLLTAKLIDGEATSAPEMLPGLLHFVVLQYLGESAAWEEMTAAPLATWRARRDAAGELPEG